MSIITIFELIDYVARLLSTEIRSLVVPWHIVAFSYHSIIISHETFHDNICLSGFKINYQMPYGIYYLELLGYIIIMSGNRELYI